MLDPGAELLSGIDRGLRFAELPTLPENSPGKAFQCQVRTMVPSTRQFPMRNPRLGTAAHDHPEPAAMRADDGVFSRTDHNSYSAICVAVRVTAGSGEHGGGPPARVPTGMSSAGWLRAAAWPSGTDGGCYLARPSVRAPGGRPRDLR